MKRFTPSSQSRYLFRRTLPAIAFVITLLLALLSGILLFNNAIISGLTSAIIDTGFDPLRAQFTAALLMTAGAALLGAALGRRRLGAIAGAGIVFWVGYLANFIQLELQPVRDPGGMIEPLDIGALVHTSFVMAALALLSAFIGAALGAALGEVLLDPPLSLIYFTWKRLARTDQPAKNSSPWLDETTEYSATQTNTLLGTLSAWLGTGIMLVLLVLASSSSDLFLFSPDIGLHSLPKISHRGTSSKLPDYGTIVQNSLISPALGGQRKPFMVYLPPSYNTPQGQSKHYPTLYLLHGAPGQDHDWFSGGKADQAADTLIALGKIPELIIILPDGNGRAGETSEWGNSFDQHQLIETYVANDLVQYIDATYRTLAQPAYRAIGGNSMGGFGAMNIAVHHPDIFGSVISLGGYYHAEGSIWGNNTAYIQVNSPADVLPNDPQAWKLHLYLGAATQDQPYYMYAKQFTKELERLHIQYSLNIQVGYHSWKIWQVQIYYALLWLRWG